jgi:hypothetical protein
MTRGEKTWLAVGILSGALLASAGVALFLKLKPTEVSSSSGSAVPQTEPADRGIGNSPGQPAVQLSPEEQAKIGLQITEVRRESITEEILAIGRVEEPETARATVPTRFGGKIQFSSTSPDSLFRVGIPSPRSPSQDRQPAGTIGFLDL